MSDFPPFAIYGVPQNIQNDLGPEKKKTFRIEKLQELRGWALNYDMDTLYLEQILFMNKQNITDFFNLINLAFQLHTKPVNKTCTKLNGYVNDVGRY